MGAPDIPRQDRGGRDNRIGLDLEVVLKYAHQRLKIVVTKDTQR